MSAPTPQNSLSLCYGGVVWDVARYVSDPLAAFAVGDCGCYPRLEKSSIDVSAAAG